MGPVLTRGHTGVLFEVLAEGKLLREIEFSCYFLHTFGGLFQQQLGLGNGDGCDPILRCTPRLLSYYRRPLQNAIQPPIDVSAASDGRRISADRPRFSLSDLALARRFLV